MDTNRRQVTVVRALAIPTLRIRREFCVLLGEKGGFHHPKVNYVIMKNRTNHQHIGFHHEIS